MGGARPCDMHLRNTQLKNTQLAQHAAEEETHCVLHTWDETHSDMHVHGEHT